MKTHIVVFGLGLLTVSSVAQAATPYRDSAVATAHAVSSQAALEILSKGGNAVDAAVAAAFTQGVVGPYHSGIGGGGFAVVYDAAGKKVAALDFREVAPAAATRDMFVRDGKAVPALSQDGALSVAVPGAVAGYLELLAKHGKLKPSVVLAPAIRAARQGIWVSPKLQAMTEFRRGCLAQDDEAARIFLRPSAEGLVAPEVRTLLKQPDLAKTLELIARKGAAGFYAGPVAKAIVSTLAAKGGLLTEKDLKDYQVRWREPLEGQYRGRRVVTMPPPSAGGLGVLQTLAMMESAFPQGMPRKSPEALHLFIESERRIFIDRAKWLGDPSFVKIPIDTLLSRAHFDELLKSISKDKATVSATLMPLSGPAPKSLPPSEKKNTTHISVVDAAGNAVALTTTINYSFGSCIVPKGTGIVLNDEMDDFAAQAFVPNVYGLVTGEGNTVAPGKVPLSSMSPTLVFQKDDPAKVLMSVGSPGGSTIHTTVAQVIMNVVDHQMDAVRAVTDGRIHHQFVPDAVMVDRFGLEPATEKALTSMGHQLMPREAWGDAELVLVDEKTQLRSAGSDPRNEGAAMGRD